MKKFTCSEMGGPCDAVIEGETMEAVMEAGHKHVVGTDDDAHKTLVKTMEEGGDEKVAEWKKWFAGEWDKKEDS